MSNYWTVLKSHCRASPLPGTATADATGPQFVEGCDEVFAEQRGGEGMEDEGRGNE